MNIETILICFTPDGALRGAHAHDWLPDGRTGEARPVKADDWPAVCEQLNKQLLADIATLRGDLGNARAELEAAQKAHEARWAAVETGAAAIVAAHRDPEVPDTQTAETAYQVAIEAVKPLEQKELEAIGAQMAALEARRKALGA